MTVRLTAAFCGASLFALAFAASAQAAPATTATAAAAAAEAGNDEAMLGEVVVTARRRSESLQEVPITVNAVTSEQLQKLNLKQFSDIASVVPGLSLNTDPMAANSSASMRGVTFAVATGAEPTVALYLNDVPVQAAFLFHSMYDVGQVEVIKGPQGTTRGISAPSGAITFNMRKPDLSDYGGYGDATVTDQGSRNFQGAVNIPIIKDVLAIRAAGVVDHNRVDGVTSINSSLRPRALTTSERFSVSYEPADIFNANVTYQHLDQDTVHFQQVSGPGHPGFTIGSVAYPASPAISPTDRLTVTQFPDQTKMRTDIVVGQIDSRIFGQHLSYVGSYMNQKTKSSQTGSSLLDLGNELPGVELKNSGPAFYKETTQELRLASDPAPDRVFDYTLGAFYRWVETGGTFTSTGPLTAGAFGPYGATPVLADFDPRYVIRAATSYPGTLQETSLFGSATIHLNANTELTGGVRHIWSINATNISINTLDAPINLGFPFPCALQQLGPQLPGFPAGSCSIPGQQIGLPLHARASETPTIYNISLSHHFTRDLLVYATTGTAFRPPTTSIGLQGALALTTDPTLSTLINHPSEHSRSYEVGFKSTWLDGRARLNAAIYRQKYSDLPIFVSNIPYFDTSSGQPSAFNFTASVNALVQGFDIDTAFQITHDWSVSLQGSYADGKIKGSLVPCSNPATPLSTTHLVSLCPGGASTTLPLWNASLQTEYTHPVMDNMDGFIRGLLTYYPENKRIEPGSGFAADKYSLMNLYLGVRAQDGSWEASIFARNIFDNKTATDVSPIEESLGSQLGLFYGPNNLFQNPALNLIHPTGYFSTSMTPPREVGVSFHYALGSR